MLALDNEIGLSSFATLAALCAGAALLAACGGKVVVDASGAGGNSVAVSATGVGGSSVVVGATGVGGSGGFTTAATGAGGAEWCSALFNDLVNKVDAAQACNPALSSPQCSGVSVVMDVCGCEVVANEKSPETAKLSLIAYEDWTLAGCGPYACESCPPPPQSPWYCDPKSEKCLPAYEK